MKRLICVTLVMILATAASSAEEPRSCMLLVHAGSQMRPSGNARIDFTGQKDLVPRLQEEATSEGFARKSPWLAGGLSLVIPGAGEFYAESYWKSASFFAAEVALWALAYTYDHKGDRQTNFFQDFANAHWSVVRYAEWTEKNFNIPQGEFAWRLTPNPTSKDQVYWPELNRMEQSIGTYYSHILPGYNSQQYYELIGKYPQFNQGWDDAGPAFNYGDPLTGRFLYYSTERGKANTYYNTASTFVAIAMVNHVVSAVDAAITAGSYNRGLHASVGSLTVPSPGGYLTVPTFQLSYGL